MRRRFVRSGSRRGVMLLIVTLVLAALTLSGAALLTLMKTEHSATATRGRKELVRGAARSAVVYLAGCLEESRDEIERNGGLYDNARLFRAVPLLTREEGGADASRFTILSPKLEDSRVEGIRYGLVDESSRLNLQAVVEWDKEKPGAGRAALMKLPGMTAIAADSILDWIDADEQPRQYGAEARYYADANLPYSPRNATPVFLEELLLARGVTRTQLYGSDEDFTYNAEDAPRDDGSLARGGSLLTTESDASAREAFAVPWFELTTVFSAEKDADPQGEARVFLNDDNLGFLYEELAPRVGANLAKFVVLYRQYGAADEKRDDAAASQTEQKSAPVAGDLSRAALDFGVRATTTFKTPLDLVGARVAVGNVEYASPIRDVRDSDNAKRLMTFLDYASTSESTTIVGRVNVNAASRPVLSALPGLAAADAQRIIEDRPDPTKPLPDDYRHASWLYTKGIVNLAQMKELYGKTTARGDVYRGQVVAFLDSSDEIERAEVVVDGAAEPPRQVFYKDLSTLGKGFSDATLLGGFVSDDDSANEGVSALDWKDASGLVELERESSGYFGSDSAFSAIDELNGATIDEPTSRVAGSPSKALESALPAVPDALIETRNAEDGIKETETATLSGRERALETLRAARGSGGTVDAAPNEGAEEENATPETSESDKSATSESKTQRALDALRRARPN